MCRFRTCIFVAAISCFCVQAFAQITIIGGVQPRRTSNVLGNADIVRMAKAQISDPNIVHTIEQNRCSFDTSPGTLVELKSQGVSETVLTAMLNAADGVNHKKRPEDAAAPLQTPNKPETSLPTEVGLYYKEGERWVAMPTELARSRHSGIFAAQLTSGMSKIKLFGVLQEPHSAVQVSSSVELLLHRGEARADEYELVEFDARKGHREFQYSEIRPIEGIKFEGWNMGDPHAIHFECEEVSARICKIKADLKKGEFGLVAPGLPASAKGDFIARVYTFAVQ